MGNRRRKLNHISHEDGKIFETVLISPDLIWLNQFGGEDWVLLLKNLIYTIIVPSTFAIYLPWLLTSEQVAQTGILRVISVTLFVLGCVGYSWSIWSFASVGRGTPAPFDAPTLLVIRGLYHHTRNPMYGSILILLVGWIVLFPSFNLFLYGISTGVSFHLFILFYEEPHLKKLFGTSYQEYLIQVDRWTPTIRTTKVNTR